MTAPTKQRLREVRELWDRIEAKQDATEDEKLLVAALKTIADWAWEMRLEDSTACRMCGINDGKIQGTIETRSTKASAGASSAKTRNASRRQRKLGGT